MEDENQENSYKKFKDLEKFYDKNKTVIDNSEDLQLLAIKEAVKEVRNEQEELQKEYNKKNWCFDPKDCFEIKEDALVQKKNEIIENNLSPIQKLAANVIGLIAKIPYTFSESDKDKYIESCLKNKKTALSTLKSCETDIRKIKSLSDKVDIATYYMNEIKEKDHPLNKREEVNDNLAAVDIKKNKDKGIVRKLQENSSKSSSRTSTAIRGSREQNKVKGKGG